MQMSEMNRADAALLEYPPLHDIGPFPPDAVFFGGKRREADFGGDGGIAQGAAFCSDEVARIRDLIHARLVENAHELSAASADLIAATPLAQYHTIANHKEHGRLLSKLGRILPAETVAEIRGMSFFDYAREAFGPFELSDEEQIGHEQICFRVVRPEAREDVGTVHRDTWFWDHYGFVVPPGKSRVKVWVPVCGTPSQAGLLLAPGSHRGACGYRTVMEGGKLGFLPEIGASDLPLGRFCGSPGEPVMFNHDVLHVGSLNRGSECRVSFEITILFDTADD
ncbi:MAG: hypothetical protein EXR07_16360 [Acetobacteraceae bacterium]|nr:hypothetical protein [Acetobacteraceae bacterium]